VARPVSSEVGYLAFDPHVVEVRLDDLFEAADEIAHAAYEGIRLHAGIIRRAPLK
jgi:hypothetical protein